MHFIFHVEIISNSSVDFSYEIKMASTRGARLAKHIGFDLKNVVTNKLYCQFRSSDTVSQRNEKSEKSFSFLFYVDLHFITNWIIIFIENFYYFFHREFVCFSAFSMSQFSFFSSKNLIHFSFWHENNRSINLLYISDDQNDGHRSYCLYSVLAAIQCAVGKSSMDYFYVFLIQNT